MARPDSRVSAALMGRSAPPTLPPRECKGQVDRWGRQGARGLLPVAQHQAALEKLVGELSCGAWARPGRL